MNNIFGNIALFCILVFVPAGIHCQTVFNLKLGYIGFHPGKNLNSALYENKLVEDGAVVVEPSVWIGFEYFLRDDHTSVEFYQGFLSDAAARSAGFSFIGFKRRFFQYYRNSFYAEIGTTISFRENWSPLAGYVEQTNYEGSGKWQTKWIWVSGGLSYYFYISKKHDLSITLWYGHYDQTLTFMLGYRFWFSTIFKHPKPCKCPFDKYDKKYKHKH
ncbi:MAG: hypothetical protein HY958_13550 [Bacteroidia bacterium]|nr:hypothetical protein [Bacteroidia bacterium]